MNEQTYWKDGESVICEVCGEPVLTGQPVQATITHNKKKRHARHFFCDGGTMTIIGSPDGKNIEVTQYGDR